jgi:hypothetical protein
MVRMLGWSLTMGGMRGTRNSGQDLCNVIWRGLMARMPGWGLTMGGGRESRLPDINL